MADPSTASQSGVPPRSGLRRRAHRGSVRLLGWLGIFGLGAGLGAILDWQDVTGWIIGLAVAGATVTLGFLLRRALDDVAKPKA